MELLGEASLAGELAAHKNRNWNKSTTRSHLKELRTPLNGLKKRRGKS